MLGFDSLTEYACNFSQSTTATTMCLGSVDPTANQDTARNEPPPGPIPYANSNLTPTGKRKLATPKHRCACCYSLKRECFRPSSLYPACRRCRLDGVECIIQPPKSCVSCIKSKIKCTRETPYADCDWCIRHEQLCVTPDSHAYVYASILA